MNAISQKGGERGIFSSSLSLPPLNAGGGKGRDGVERSSWSAITGRGERKKEEEKGENENEEEWAEWREEEREEDFLPSSLSTLPPPSLPPSSLSSYKRMVLQWCEGGRGGRSGSSERRRLTDPSSVGKGSH